MDNYGSSDEDSEDHRRLLAGDKNIFAKLFRKHNGAMLRIAAAVLKNQASAEEIAQETWIAVLENIAAFEGKSPLAGWIFTILMNKARTRAVRDGRTVSFSSHVELGQGGSDDVASNFKGNGTWQQVPALWDELTPERVVLGQELLVHVRNAIDALPPMQRSVLILRGQQGLEPDIVCELLDLSPGNMRLLLHRARYKIRTIVNAVLK